jgi:hypothetical protein
MIALPNHVLQHDSEVSDQPRNGSGASVGSRSDQIRRSVPVARLLAKTFGVVHLF